MTGLKAKDRARIKKMVAALKRYDPERVILFGSAARGDGDEHSDVDIVLSNSYQLTSIEWRIL